jgi:AraC-like DNA-binding protein
LTQAGVPARWPPGTISAFGDPVRDVAWRRETVHDSPSLLIEDSALPFAQALGRDYAPNDQFAFPYFGVFRWRVGSFERLIDANAILRIRGGEEAFETHPVQGVGHASAILTPSPALLDEVRALSRRAGGDVAPIVTSMDDRTRLMVHDILFNPISTILGRDEASIDLLAVAMGTGSAAPPRPSPLVEKAKEILHDRFAEPLSLEQIARDLGVTPVYLTQIFRRQEGLPLYRYQTRLRLSRALLLLPDCASITELALDLGYSSHAHFTATFSTVFGITPRAFRASRNGGRPIDWTVALGGSPQDSRNGSDREAWPNA